MAVELAEVPVRPGTPIAWRSIDRRLIAAALVGAYVLSGIYVVSADQQAVVLRFGAVAETRVPAGVHWTWPYPIGRVQTLRVREMKRLMLGLDANEPVKRSQYLTGDRNILNIRLVVQFAINDPVAYLFRAADVNVLVGNAARGALAQVVAGRHVDDLLTTEGAPHLLQCPVGVLLLDVTNRDELQGRYRVGWRTLSTEGSARSTKCHSTRRGDPPTGGPDGPLGRTARARRVRGSPTAHRSHRHDDAREIVRRGCFAWATPTRIIAPHGAPAGHAARSV